MHIYMYARVCMYTYIYIILIQTIDIYIHMHGCNNYYDCRTISYTCTCWYRTFANSLCKFPEIRFKNKKDLRNESKSEFKSEFLGLRKVVFKFAFLRVGNF